MIIMRQTERDMTVQDGTGRDRTRQNTTVQDATGPGSTGHKGYRTGRNGSALDGLVLITL